LATLVLSWPIIVAAFSSIDALRFASGDQAIIEMYADGIPASLPLVGAYSRLGFHHPGPMLHYLVSLPVHLFGAYGMNLTAAAVAIACLAGLLMVMYRRGGQPLFALAVVFAIILTRSMGLGLLRGPAAGARCRRQVRTAEGIPEWATFHDLRHFYASALLREGESVKVVQARLGHASASETLDTYSHLWPDSEDETRMAIDNVLGTTGDQLRTNWAV